MKRYAFALIGLAAVALAGCPKKESSDESLTLGEAADALTETSASTQATELASTSVELSTNFTIGSAVEKAADELRGFISSQLPCAEITAKNATLTITYGAKPGKCYYNGHTFSGQSSVTVSRNDNAEVVVDHTWTGLSNGLITVSGSAHVTWNVTDKTRHVQHNLTWTRISDNRSGTGTGDRVQTPLAGGKAEGIHVDGVRTWDGTRGHWDLSIQGVEVRWADPVPQAGAYVLVTPKGKTLTMSFKRVDDDSIQVTVASGSRSFKLNVNKAAGDVEPAS